MRRLLALLLLAGCPGADDDNGEDGPASGATTEASTGGETSTELCPACDAHPLCHSFAPDGHCVCEAGYEWADPENDEDFTCMPIPPREGEEGCLAENHAQLIDGTCWCEQGYVWCSDDAADLTCCPDPAQGTEATG